MNFVLSHYEEGSLGKQFEAETHGRGTYWMSFLQPAALFVELLDSMNAVSQINSI